MFYTPIHEKDALRDLPRVIHTATHNPSEAESFHYSPVVRSRAILGNPKLAEMMWEACAQRAVTYDHEAGTLTAYGSTLAQSFPTQDGQVLWVLRAPPSGWGAFPLMDEANRYRNPVYDGPDHIRAAATVLHAVYGYERDGTPRAAIGTFAGVLALYTPHGIFEFLPGRPVALIPEQGSRRVGVLAEYEDRWAKKGARRRVSRVTGDPSVLRPPPLIRGERDLELFLTGRLPFPPMRPVEPVRGRGNFSPDRQLEWEDTMDRYMAELDEWEEKYGMPRAKRPAITVHGARDE